MAYSRRASIMSAKRKRSVKRRLTTGIRRKYAATKLARFAQSRFRMRRGKMLARKLNNVGETKLIALNNFDEEAPVAIQNFAIVSKCGFVMGGIPNNWDADLNDLGGTLTQQGTSAFNRIGNYVYFKKAHVTFQVDMNVVSDGRPPTQFRMIIAKARQSCTPAGITNLPQNSLFLSTSGNPVGHSTSNITGMDLMNQPLNKREWVIFKDKRFTLSHPLNFTNNSSSTAVINSTYSGKYPMRKTIKCNLNYFKKTRIRPDSNQPDDLDPHYVVYFYASSLGKDAYSNGWEITTRGTTSFNDV